jgi:hypothetical protein
MSADPKPLRPGDLVYRVNEADPPAKGPHTWTVASVAVEQASTKQIKLKSCSATGWRVKFEPGALGRVFFATPAAAIAAFLAAKRRELEILERRRKDSERAIAWAVRQQGAEE